MDISPSLISTVIDSVVDEVAKWQARPLDGVWPILYLDAGIGVRADPAFRRGIRVRLPGGEDGTDRAARGAVLGRAAATRPLGRVDAVQHLTRAPRQDGARVLRSDHLKELPVRHYDLTLSVEDDGRPQHGIHCAPKIVDGFSRPSTGPRPFSIQAA